MTIPSEVREVLDLKDGDVVDIQILRVVGRGKKSVQPLPGDASQ